MAKVKNELTLIPKIKIHPSKIILYNEIHWSHHRPSKANHNYQESTLIQVEVDGKLELKRISNSFLNSSRTSNGILSKQAIKRLKLSIEYLLLLNKPNNGKSGNTGRHYNKNITFITLTLPSKQIHTDKEIKEECLNQFMIELHKYHRITNYVWKAEYQQNGNIHFHILTNRFIAWNDVRNRWNRIINKLGYVDRYRSNLEEYHKNGFQVRTDLLTKWPLEKQLKAYQEGKKTDWHNPNSIDVHSIANITNIGSYLIKYMTKTEQSKKETTQEGTEKKKDIGRIWSASTVLSKISGADTEVDNQIEENLKTIKEHFKNSFFVSDYFTVIDITIENLETLKCLELLNLFYRYLYEHFNFSYQLKL